MRTVITSIAPDASTGRFVDFLHTKREDERTLLARAIHDDLGGLLVAAAMDLGWVESHSPGSHVLARLRRVGVSLAGAIAMKRNMIEQLRPTLLDTFGLFEALRWYFKHACQNAEIQCSERLPQSEASLTPAALSHIFRSTQTLLDCTFQESDLKSVELEARCENNQLFLRIGHQHTGPETYNVLDHFRNELTSAAHRIATCCGELSFDSHEKGLEFYVTAPLVGERINV